MLHVRIPDPSALPGVEPEQALEFENADESALRACSATRTTIANGAHAWVAARSADRLGQLEKHRAQPLRGPPAVARLPGGRQSGARVARDPGAPERLTRERPQDQFELVRIAVKERGRTAGQRWRADCVSRRVGVRYGLPITTTESGYTAQRANQHFYMLRDVRIARARELMAEDVSEQLERASQSLASGTALTGG